MLHTTEASVYTQRVSSNSPFAWPPPSGGSAFPSTPLSANGWPTQATAGAGIQAVANAPNPALPPPAYSFAYTSQTVPALPGVAIASSDALKISATQKKAPAPAKGNASKQGETTASRLKHAFGFIYPALAFSAAPVLIASHALGLGQVEKTVMKGLRPQKILTYPFKENRLFRQAKKLGLPLSGEGLTQAHHLATKGLALGLVPKCMVQLQYGWNAMQPTMVLSQLLNLTALPYMAKGHPMATVIEYLAGATFTVGLANDMENQIKKKQGNTAPLREDPTLHTLLKAVTPGNGMGPLHRRTLAFAGSLKNAALFVVKDHINMVKSTGRVLNELVHGRNPLKPALPPPPPLPQVVRRNGRLYVVMPPTPQASAKDEKDAASPILSRTGVTFVYLAALPKLLLGVLPQKFPMKNTVQGGILASSVISGSLIDLSMILLALNGQKLAEKLPLVGTSLEYGSSFASMLPSDGSPLLRGIKPFINPIRQLGGAINTLYYKFRAEHV